MSNGFYSESLVEHISKFVGEVVTIFATCGGQSGCGFTGVVLAVNPCFVRLITNIPEMAAPSCALGNDCCNGLKGRNRCNNNGRGGVGSVTDIPVDRIAAFVHNAV